MRHSKEVIIKVLRDCFQSPGKTVAEVAAHWQVPIRDVYRWKSLFNNNQLFQEKESHKINHIYNEDIDLLLSFFYHHPVSYLAEASAYVLEHTGHNLRTSTISKIVADHDITRKVVELRALEQNSELRRIFQVHVKQYSVHQLVFVDETSCNPTTFRRKYGWSFRGLPAFYSLYQQLHGEGRSLSSIVALSSTGVLAYSIHSETIDANTFTEALVNDILPRMNEFPQENSVLILDHSRTHDPLTVIEECEKRGVLLLFLPPYSYDFAPIELSFHQMKDYLKKRFPMEKISEQKLVEALHQIKEVHAIRYFNHCGYY